MATLAGISVTAYIKNGVDWDSAGSATTNSVGEYDIGGLEPGTYRVEFKDGDGEYLGIFYNQVADLASATDIVVAAGAIVTGINAQLSAAAHITGTVTSA